MLSASGAGLHLAREQILIVRQLGRPKHFYSVSYRGLSLAAMILFGRGAPFVFWHLSADFACLLE